MKKIKFLKILIPALLIAMASFSGCERLNVEPSNVQIYGVWSLCSTRGGFSPDFTYNVGEILWAIDNDTIFVSNNSSSQYPFPSFNDGYYTYSKTSDTITLNGVFAYEYNFINDSLILRDGVMSADGKEFIFVKFDNQLPR